MFIVKQSPAMRLSECTKKALLTYSVPLAAVRLRLILVNKTYALHVPSLYMI